ncbi:hypothetical protein MVES1_000761 [Malassezia vespertilionis]|nr:uncharacterized protein MVES1_000761 [Malassezia vespertilionis]WFD05431.1 hypothetical protein MVES1_000761 [Malassezia vespertilionis]
MLPAAYEENSPDTPLLDDTTDVEPLVLPGVASPVYGTTPKLGPCGQELPPPLFAETYSIGEVPHPETETAGAKVLTASAVFSRSGALHPSAIMPRRGSLAGRKEYAEAMRRASDTNIPLDSQVVQEKDWNMGVFLTDLWRDVTAAPQQPPLPKRAQQTGSALEAIGALFLRRDSAGRLEDLTLRQKEASADTQNNFFWTVLLQLKMCLLLLKKLLFFLTDLVFPKSNPRTRVAAYTDGVSDKDAPSTPVAMPGMFVHDHDDGLLLPPPFLDEYSDPRSFEGLLGVRRMREQRQRRQRLDKLSEQNRPAHRVDILTALSNFVTSAKASEKRREMERRPRRDTGFGFGFSKRSEQVPWTTARLFARRKTPASDTPIEPCLQKASPGLQSSAYASDPEQRTPPSLCAQSGSKSAPTTPASIIGPADFVADKSTQTASRLTPLAMLQMGREEGKYLASAHVATKHFVHKNTPSPDAQALRAVSVSSVWMCLSYCFVALTLTPDFVVFLLAHLLDVAIETYETLAEALWFLRWIWQNVTAQTVLGRCCYDAYKLIKAEWSYVALEDHEARSERRRPLPKLGWQSRRGLSVLQVLHGFLELVCLQSVTRERYQHESAELVKIEEWKSRVQHNGADSRDDELVVTNRSNDILEIASTALTDEPAYDPSVWEENTVSLVRNIKWASQLSMSAYGLQVLIVDLPPVFTPSGHQLPRQTFAHLSRLNADDVVHAEIQALNVEATYSPTFYIIRDMRRKVVCVAVRGTQSFADIVVDLDMRTEDVTPSLAEWRGVERGSNTERFSYHAGIWRAAEALVQPGSTLFNKLCDTLNEYPEFGLVFVGHSLGGAIASAATILLSEYHLDGDADASRGIWRTVDTNGFSGGRRIRAITFAHPSTLSYNLSHRTSFGAVPLVTTVIYGSDIIPRFGHGQIRELRRVLGALTRVRRRRHKYAAANRNDAKKDSDCEAVGVHVLRRYCDWLSICYTDRPDDVMRDRKRNIEDTFWRLRREVEDDLYAQAKHRFDKANTHINAPISPWIQAVRQGDVPLHTLSTRRQRMDQATLSNEAAHGGTLVPAGRILWIADGDLYTVTDPRTFFSLPDLTSSLFADHFPAAYEEAVAALGKDLR